jgi:hypothetical protein
MSKKLYVYRRQLLRLIGGFVTGTVVIAGTSVLGQQKPSVTNEKLALQEVNERAINNAMQSYLQKNDTRPIVQVISSQAKYPINSFEELVGPLGGENTKIPVEGMELTLVEAKRVIPPSFFPIESQEDLEAKLALIQTRGRRNKKAPKTKPPQISAEQIHEQYKTQGGSESLLGGQECVSGCE